MMIKLKIISIVFGIISGTILLEFFLYLLNYSSISELHNLSPGKYETDANLGWIHKPGIYQFQSIDNNKTSSITVTYWKNGSRASRAEENKTGKLVLLLGCSFIEGYGLDDQDTITWNLQKLRNDLRVENLGVNGYGTLHSYLNLKEKIKSYKENEIVIIYGYADFHKYRNIKNPLIQTALKDKEVYPYCTLNDCLTWQGQKYNKLLSKSRVYSAGINLYETIKIKYKQSEVDNITLNLIKKMQELAKNSSAKFLIAPVDLKHSPLLENIESQAIVCQDPLLYKKSSYLNDGHPNSLWTKSFAECLSKYL